MPRRSWASATGGSAASRSRSANWPCTPPRRGLSRGGGHPGRCGFGPGTAGVGIADQIRDAMIRDGASREQATGQVWLVDKQGLLTSDLPGLRDYQQTYARQRAEVAGWSSGGAPVTLLDTVGNAKPTILLGPSPAPRPFTREAIQAMSAPSDRPVTVPTRNPP